MLNLQIIPPDGTEALCMLIVKTLCVAAKAVKIIKFLAVIKVIVAVFAFIMIVKNTVCSING